MSADMYNPTVAPSNFVIQIAKIIAECNYDHHGLESLMPYTTAQYVENRYKEYIDVAGVAAPAFARMQKELDALKTANGFLMKEIKELIEKADADFGDFTLGDARNWLVDTLKQHEAEYD